MGGRLLFILGELKAYSEHLPKDKREEFQEKLENAKEESFSLYAGKEKAEEERDEQKRRHGKNRLSLCFALILIANFLLFPLINFIVRYIDPNAPQIVFEMEKFVKIFLSFLGAG